MADDRTLGYNKAALYWAGKHFFPDAATIVAETDNASYAQGPTIQSEADWVGSPAALDVVMKLCDQLQRSAKKTSSSLERIGENLVTLANDFEATDDGVASAYRERLKILQRDYPDPTPNSKPPATKNPYPYNPNAGPTSPVAR